MAGIKFEKDSREWKMFTDYWKLCQKHWQVEATDEYWENLVNDARDFFNKYKDIPLSKNMIFAYIDTQKKLYEVIKGK